MPRPPVKPKKQRFERDEIARLLIAARGATSAEPGRSSPASRSGCAVGSSSDCSGPTSTGRAGRCTCARRSRRGGRSATSPWRRGPSRTLQELRRLAGEGDRVLEIQPNTSTTGCTRPRSTAGSRRVANSERTPAGDVRLVAARRRRGRTRRARPHGARVDCDHERLRGGDRRRCAGGRGRPDLRRMRTHPTEGRPCMKTVGTLRRRPESPMTLRC